MEILRGLLGIVILLGICYWISSDKKSINWRLVVTGMLLQILMAFLLIRVEPIRNFFSIIVDFFLMVIASAEKAASFMFGDLALGSPFGFAFSVLPILVFFSALSSVLYYLGFLQKIVYGFAWLMNKTIKISGVESLAAAANIFVGQTEAPLVIKPYLEKMTRSEMMCVMTGGFATIAGSVFAAYLGIVGSVTESMGINFGMHLLTASIISAPAAIVAAKIIIPESKDAPLQKDLKVPKLEAGSNLLDAITRGTTDGVKLAVNVAAMLLAYTALIYFINAILLKVGDFTPLNSWIAANTRFDGLSLELFLGTLCAPIAWILGVPYEDITVIGQLLGEKTVLNEFIAYLSLGDLVKEGELTNPKSIIIATYALCGFANFASIGIQIGGIGSLAPGQRQTLTELGIRALIGGTIAAFLTAAIAGMIV